MRPTFAIQQFSQLQKLVSVLTNQNLAEPSFSEQEHARQILIEKRDELQAAAELSQARLRQLQRALNHSTAQWWRAENTLQSLAGILEKLQTEANANRFLTNATSIGLAELSQLLVQWKKLQSQLESRHPNLLSIHRSLTHPRLICPPELQKTRAAILEKLVNGEAILGDETLPELSQNWRREYSQLYKNWHAAQNDVARWNSLRRLQNSDELRALDRLGNLRSRPFPQAAQMREAIQTEIDKQCPRDGHLLPGEATCNACDLAFGERISLCNAHEIETFQGNAILALRSALQEESAHVYLSRQAGSTPLLQWDGALKNLLPLLTDNTLDALEIAFKPRRRVTRNLADLQAQFSNCHTREEFETAFQNWLGGAENLAGDDEVELS